MISTREFGSYDRTTYHILRFCDSQKLYYQFPWTLNKLPAGWPVRKYEAIQSKQ